MAEDEPPGGRERGRRRITALAEGPFTRAGGAPLTVSLAVPLERLDAGPVSSRFVLQIRAAGASRAVPVALTPAEDPWGYADAPAPDRLEDLLGDSRFLAQHVYAVAASTLGLFEQTLGRRLPWRGRGHRLRLSLYDRVPYDQTGYDWLNGVIRFGHRRDARARRHVPLALYRDLVVHEVTHAILDGYRPHFSDPDGTLDQHAVHEAVADIVAMLSVFSSTERVEQQLRAPAARDEPGPRDLETRLVESGLFGVADGLFSRHALRRSITTEVGADWRRECEPHKRGEVLVRAVMDTVLRVWKQQLQCPGGRSSRFQIAQAGARAGAQVCAMVVRGLGHTPPVDVTFEDVLRGILAADLAVAPDDDLGARAVARQAFAALGVAAAPDDALSGMAELPGLRYPVRLAALASDPEEMYRFLWENPVLMAAVALDASFPVVVERVRPSVRVGPDGFVVAEIGASFYQQVTLSPLQARRRLGLRSRGPVVLSGGGLLRFDETGRLSFAALKPVLDADRQAAKLAESESRSELGPAADLPADPVAARTAVFRALHSGQR